jgi:hypothetical protein
MRGEAFRTGLPRELVLLTSALVFFLFSGCSRRETESSPGAAPVTSPLRPPFTDVTREAGIDFVHECGARGNYWLPEEMGAGGAFFDYDGDDDLDLYLVQGGALSSEDSLSRNRLYENDGLGSYRDVSEESGADVPGYGMGCAACDYDGDGDVDLYVTRLGPNVLLRNDGGRFTDVTREAGVGDPGFGTSAAFLDYDRDGRLDLYVANYVNWAPGREATCFDRSGIRDYCGPADYDAPSIHRLYRGNARGGFDDVTERAGIAGSKGNGLGVLCTDFDGDGWVDIYVANDQTPAFLWINQGDGTFVEDAPLRGCGYSADGVAIAGMGVAAEDLDGDETFDLVVTNIHDQVHLALANDSGFFTDKSHEWGFGGWGVPYTGFGIALFDQDHDGSLDGFVVNGAVNRLAEPVRPGHEYAEPAQLIRRDAAGRFYDASAELRSIDTPLEMGRGLLAGDIDGDGDLDLCITNNRGPTQLLRNECSNESSWTMLRLVGQGGNRQAINARVRIETAGKVFVKEVRPHAGYLGTNDRRIHVGLGRAHSIEKIEVRWPDGRSESWRELPVKRYLVLVQGSSPQVSFENETAFSARELREGASP